MNHPFISAYQSITTLDLTKAFFLLFSCSLCVGLYQRISLLLEGTYEQPFQEFFTGLVHRRLKDIERAEKHPASENPTPGLHSSKKS